MKKHQTNTDEEYLKGKKIAQCGDFCRVREQLSKEGLLETNESFIRKKYKGFFEGENFQPEDNIWITLTILGLYDTATLEHCLRTFSITKNIATKTLLGPWGARIVLKEYIEEGEVSLRDLFVAALGHDIGKIILPVEILHNSLTDEEMNRILIDMIWRGDNVEEIGIRIGFTAEELSHKSTEEIVSRLYERGMRPVNIVPLSEAFSDSRNPGLLATLKSRGFSEKETIKNATKIHESEGQKIFEELGEPIVADLVGHHHNYQKHSENELRHVMRISSLKSHGEEAVFGTYNIIKIADTLDSLESKRPYKKGMSKLAALAELAHQALTHRIEKSICYLWINTEYTEITEMMRLSGINSFNDTASVETIEKFLSQTEQTFDRRMVDR